MSLSESNPLRPRSEPRSPALWESLIPVVVLIGLIGTSIVFFDQTAHIPLVLASAVAGLIGFWLGNSWSTIEQGIVDGIKIALTAILILMAIGILIGTWIAGGIVPLLIYYGLELLSPNSFLVAACLICSIISLATGSSWTTAGTVGIALIGVGDGLGIPLPMVAGAIVSGAYFGDKMSPLSDTTNLAPAATGIDLFEHIRYMVYTTVPALVTALLIYGILGSSFESGEASGERMALIQTTLRETFDLSPLLLLPPVAVILMVIYRIPALPALLVGAFIGGLMGIFLQGSDTQMMLGVAYAGYVSETGVQSVDSLLTRGGLDSMMSTVSLILCALTFGGIMERIGMLQTMANAILRFARSTGRLVTTTLVTCIGMNVLAPDQYLSIIVPGRMYRDAYRRQGLHAKNLARTLEDGGTLSSPLVPWNTCGAYMAKVLDVYPFAYAPFAFFNWITPLVAILYAFTGWKIESLPKETAQQPEASQTEERREEVV